MAQASANRKRSRVRRKNVAATNFFPVLIEKDGDGYYASCPILQGCYTQGDTYEETLANIADAIRLHVEDRLAHGEPLPTTEAVSLTTVEVRV